jgi:hypothetical protein
MSDNQSIDHRIATWLEGEAAGSLPDRVLESVFAQTRVAPRRSRLFAGRFQTVSRYASALVAVGAAAIIVVAAAALIWSAPPAASPRPTGSAAAAVYPTPAPAQTHLEPTLQPPSSPQPMTIDASGFVVPFTMTWPAPVQLPLIKPDGVEIHARYGTGFVLFQITRVGKDPCMTDEQLPAALTTPQQFMDWLGSISHASAGPVSSTTVDGQPALERTFDVDSSLAGCVDPGNLHSGIKTQLAEGYPGGFYMAVGDHERWVAFTVKGKLVAFVIWPLTSQAFVTEAGQAIATIHFNQ